MASSHGRLRRVARWALLGAGALLLIVVAAVGVACLVYPPTYLARMVLWGGSNVGDIYRFPSRPLPASPAPYRFREVADMAPARGILQSTSQVPDFEHMLEDTGTEAFLVVRNDTLIYEAYFNGSRRDSLNTSFSVAKSVTSALVGIALAEGKIHSLDDPITRYLPELAARDPRFSLITLRHLVTMASGIRFVTTPFPNSDAALHYYYPDLRALLLKRIQIARPPGVRWLYTDYNPQLMGMILERTTGMTVTAYLEQKLWLPLGTEYPASWSVDHDPGGFEKMDTGVNARTIDFAKFGKLYLDGGRWNDRQVVPAAWVIESTTADPGRGRSDYYSEKPGSRPMAMGETGYYAYWWWGWNEPDGARTFAAIGDHGQYLFVSPSDHIVIVRNGKSYGRPTPEWMAWFKRAAHAFGAQARQ